MDHSARRRLVGALLTTRADPARGTSARAVPGAWPGPAGAHVVGAATQLGKGSLKGSATLQRPGRNAVRESLLPRSMASPPLSAASQCISGEGRTSGAQGRSFVLAGRPVGSLDGA